MNRRDFFSVCSNVGSTIFSAEILQQLSHNYAEEIEKRVHASEAVFNDKIRKFSAVFEDKLTEVNANLDQQKFDLILIKSYLALVTVWMVCITSLYGFDVAIRFVLLVLSLV